MLIVCSTIERAQECLLDKIPSKTKLGIKVHFGRSKKPNSHIPPAFFEPLKKRAKVEFIDTNTLYGGERGNTIKHRKLAQKHGFDPVLIMGEDEVKDFGKAQVPNDLIKYDIILNAAHFTGHKIVGYGGCIKNIGMGMVTAKSKLWVHAASKLVFNSDKCKECGWCEDNCKYLSKLGIRKECIKCGKCVGNCSAVSFTFGKQTEVAERLARVAVDVAKNVEMLHMNYIHNPTKLCDCMGDHTDCPICEHFGIIIGSDAAVVDETAIDTCLHNYHSLNLAKRQVAKYRQLRDGKAIQNFFK